MATIEIENATDNELRKALAIPFLADSAKAELARRKAEADAENLEAVKEAAREAAINAGYPHLADGFTFSDGTTMDFLALVDFAQRTLALQETDPKAMWALAQEAHIALGDYKKEGLGKWKSLAALKGATK